jgi:DNA-directed RNA polymerase subunit RPC12/RpoP
MADKIKCTCASCGAKYRLPMEAQGRTARCKRCGSKFEVPREQSLEDSILTWLNPPDEDDVEHDAPQPRIVNMPGREEGEEAPRNERKPTIRVKEGARKSESA